MEETGERYRMSVRARKMRSMITPMPSAAGVAQRPDATAQRDALIPVTRPALPDAGRYARYVQGIFDRAWMTNAGPLVQELVCPVDRRVEDPEPARA